MRLLVTGATGFIGRPLVRHFNELGWTAISGIRSGGHHNHAENLGVNAIRIDEGTGHFDISGQIDGLVHLAGIAHAHGVDAEEYRNANAVWTQKLARRAAVLRIPRFIFISTVKVAGDSHPEPIDESAPFAPNDFYASSKATAEMMLEEVGRQSELRIITIRPPLVYGPGVKANFLSLLRVVDAGWPLALASIRNRRSLVYVGNLVSAIEACLTRPVAPHQTFFVSDDHDVSTPQLVEAIATALGKRPRLLPFPPRVLQCIGGLVGRREQVARLTESMQVKNLAYQDRNRLATAFLVAAGARGDRVLVSDTIPVVGAASLPGRGFPRCSYIIAVMETGASALTLAPLLAGIVSIVTMIVLLRSGSLPLDKPNERSLHAVPVPRTGGIAIIAGLVAAALWLRSSPVLLIPAVALAVASYFDDRHTLPAGVRLALHLVVSGVFLWLTAGTTVASALVVLWLFVAWTTNLYNFMDGSDGLAGGMTVVGFGTYAFAAWLGGNADLELLAWSITAAAMGFLIFNFPPAKIFMGDVGSIPLGFLVGAVGIAGWQQGLWPLWFPLVVFAPFIVDASATLARRILRGERVWEAHREHYYQRLILSGWSHRRTAMAEYGLMLLCAAAALAGLRQPPAGQVAFVLAPALAIVTAMWAIDKRWKRFSGAVRG